MLIFDPILQQKTFLKPEFMTLPLFINCIYAKSRFHAFLSEHFNSISSQKKMVII